MLHRKIRRAAEALGAMLVLLVMLISWFRV
jgi:hypothetical protein